MKLSRLFSDVKPVIHLFNLCLSIVKTTSGGGEPVFRLRLIDSGQEEITKIVL